MAPHNKAEPAYAVKPGGAHAVGPLRLIQGENEPYAGWEQRPAAVAEFGRHLHFPMFGWAHTKLRKQGGGGAFNGAFLAVRVINPADDTYGALVEGFWILEKEDLPKAYNKRPGIRVRGGVLLSENGPPFRTAETGAWRVMGGVSAAPLGPGLR